MFLTKASFILCGIFIHCALANKLYKSEKCSINDDPCLLKSFGAVIQEAAESGIPDAGLPILDPYLFKDVNVTLMGMIQAIIPEATFKGIKDCVIASYHEDIENKVATAKYDCPRLSAEGSYNIQSTPVLSAMMGGLEIHGEGKGGLVVDNVHLDLKVPFLLQKLDDSELHFVVQGDEVTYTYTLGKAVLKADNLYIGNQEISALAVNIFNENSELFTKIFAKSFLDYAIQLFVEYTNKISAAVPAKDMVFEDLSAYST